MEEGEGPNPVRRSISAKLAELRPLELVIEDQSDQHAGHSGTKGLRAGETHFAVRTPSGRKRPRTSLLMGAVCNTNRGSASAGFGWAAGSTTASHQPCDTEGLCGCSLHTASGY